MSDLRAYLNNITSHDYKLAPTLSDLQQSRRTDSIVSENPIKIIQNEAQSVNSIQSQSFSFATSEKDKGSQAHWQSLSKKYVSYNPEQFIEKTDNIMSSKQQNISINDMKQLMNEALEILSVVQQGKNVKNQLFTEKLMNFLDWIQNKINVRKVKPIKTHKMCYQGDQKNFKKRQFYDRNGKVTIEIRKLEPRTTARR